MASHNDLSASGLYKSDPQLKDLPFDKYSKLASNESVERTKKALESKGFKADVFETGQEALEFIKSTIPSGATVMNAGSTTLVPTIY